MIRKTFRVCVVPTNAGEELVLRYAERHHMQTAGMAREGDYEAAFTERFGLYQILDYDAPERTRAACRAAVARECDRVFLIDNAACAAAWKPALGRAVEVVVGPRARPDRPRGDALFVCCPEPPAWLRAWLHDTFRRWYAEMTVHPRVHALRTGAPPRARAPPRAVGPSKLIKGVKL